MLKISISFLFVLCSIFGSGQRPEVRIVVLGNVQDAGSPQVTCKKDCCKGLFSSPPSDRMVVSIGLIVGEKTYLIDATPDLPAQLHQLNQVAAKEDQAPDGIFLTHAHIGHYSGMMYLGKEAMNADQVVVHTMPRMTEFIRNNGPWDQLVHNSNIALIEMRQDTPIDLGMGVTVTPFLVPHRDEYSETVGYRIDGPNKSLAFIPDIDKWSKWEKDIVELIASVDHAFLDGTFYDSDELPGRDMSEIPHPFVVESMLLLKELSSSEKDKVHFVHFNHTNPLLDPKSTQSQAVEKNGFHIARFNDIFEL